MLARMQKVSRTAHKFSNPRLGEGELQRPFRNSFQIWQSENAELEQIVLRFSGRAAQLVRERNWHSSQQIQELAGGNLELFRTASDSATDSTLAGALSCRLRLGSSRATDISGRDI